MICSTCPSAQLFNEIWGGATFIRCEPEDPGWVVVLWRFCQHCIVVVLVLVVVFSSWFVAGILMSVIFFFFNKDFYSRSNCMCYVTILCRGTLWACLVQSSFGELVWGDGSVRLWLSWKCLSLPGVGSPVQPWFSIIRGMPTVLWVMVAGRRGGADFFFFFWIQLCSTLKDYDFVAWFCVLCLS